MKYNQQSRKEYLENDLKDILVLLSIDEQKVADITFREIRTKLNQVYPPLSAPEGSLDYPAIQSFYRDRTRIFNNSRHLLY